MRKRASRVYAFRKFRAPISNKHNKEYTPLIVPPVYLKNFEKPVFQALWKICTRHLSTARRIVFLGYSMPPADFHAQFIMRCGFHNQKEGQLDKYDRRKESTGPAEVVIVNPDFGAARRHRSDRRIGLHVSMDIDTGRRRSMESSFARSGPDWLKDRIPAETPLFRIRQR